jgi:hypothetical protein
MRQDDEPVFPFLLVGVGDSCCMEWDRVGGQLRQVNGGEQGILVSGVAGCRAQGSSLQKTRSPHARRCATKSLNVLI